MNTSNHFVTKDQLENKFGNATNFVAQDEIFQSIAGQQWAIYMSSQKYPEAADLWREVLERTNQWESKNNRRIHKGTLYYFFAVPCLLSGNYEQGFLLMHQALEEDIKTMNTTTPNTPAWKFVTLDYESNDQFMKPMVSALAGYLESLISEYRTQTGSHFTLDQMKQKFLENYSLRDSVFSFVYELFQTKELMLTSVSNIYNNAFGTYRLVNRIFSLCLITDAVIALKANVDFRFIDKVTGLAKISNMNLTNDKIGKFNSEFKSSFEHLLSQLIDDSSKPLGMCLNIKERSLLITYGFRNFAAHKIEEQRIVVDNYRKIIQSIFNTLFLSIEKFY